MFNNNFLHSRGLGSLLGLNSFLLCQYKEHNETSDDIKTRQCERRLATTCNYSEQCLIVRTQFLSFWNQRTVSDHQLLVRTDATCSQQFHHKSKNGRSEMDMGRMGSDWCMGRVG